MAKSPDRKLLGMLASYHPQVVTLALAARDLVLEEAPEALESDCKGYAVSIMFSFTGKPLKDGFCHVVAYSNHVNLGFNRGASLADPSRLLEGNGKAIRHITIHGVEDLERPFVRRFIRAAIEMAERGVPTVSNQRSRTKRAGKL